MNNLIYDDNGELVFSMQTCTNRNISSPYKFLDTESHAYLIVPIELVEELNLEDSRLIEIGDRQNEPKTVRLEDDYGRG